MDARTYFMLFQPSKSTVTAREATALLARDGELLTQAAALCADDDAPPRHIDLNTAQALLLGRPGVKKPRPQGIKRRGFFADQENKHGAHKYLHEWWKTKYYVHYIEGLRDAAWYEEEGNEEKDATMRKQFEAAIRMPLRTFQSLLKEMEADPFMYKNPEKNAVPISVCLMASLRYLALGCVWDGIADIFCVSRRTLDDWFKQKFLIWMMKNKYHKYIKTPSTTAELRVLEKPFEQAGFPGMFALCDGVHIWWTGYSWGVKNTFKGKEKYTTVVFNVTVDYDGKPIFVSDLATGTTNDKLLVNNHDDFVGIVLQTDPVFTDYAFKLSTKDGILLTKGAYLGVDNGYHHERHFVAPSKHERCGTWAYTWSKWLESLRKKCECFFGRLKRKYRILTQGINIRHLGRKRMPGSGVEVGGVEDIFKVCCCLDVMVQEDKGAYCGGEPDWRQLDDTELEEVEGGRGVTPAWLHQFKTRQAELDEEARQAALPRQPALRRVERPEPEPEEPLEAIAGEHFKPLASLNELTVALIDQFSRFKTGWRRANPGAANRR